jgi:hypothetical protein
MIFYLTVGQIYRREEHPCGWHPDGYVVVEAEDYREARDKVWAVAGGKWCFLYEESKFDFSFHPRGEIGRL